MKVGVASRRPPAPKSSVVDTSNPGATTSSQQAKAVQTTFVHILYRSTIFLIALRRLNDDDLSRITGDLDVAFKKESDVFTMTNIQTCIKSIWTPEVINRN